jgi:hypothetical protein
VSWDDLASAFEFVSADGVGGHKAFLCRPSGKVYWHSDFDDDVDELPEDIEDDKYLQIPGKGELGLGKPLVLEFASQILPDDYDAVRQIFSRKGAYGRFKDLLARRGVIDQWYDFEAKAAEKALRAWCDLNSIAIAPDIGPRPVDRSVAPIPRSAAATSDSARRAMDPGRILDRLAVVDHLPVEAIRAADADRATMAPVFVQKIENYLAADDLFPDDALFFIFHMLGSWREKSAYRPLAKLLRRPSGELDAVLSDAVTDTSHRVMAAVFDGDPQPLYDVILDPESDDFVRSRMCETVAIVTLRGGLSRTEAARFLRACWTDIEPQDECFVWNGWQSAIALLGLVELAPLVEQAFERGFISQSWSILKDFKEDLQRTIAGGALPPRLVGEYSVFGDTIEELSTWDVFKPKPATKNRRDAGNWNAGPLLNVPAVNPYKGIGRNDPCPCGSGKKFKKCCLDKPVAPQPDIGDLLGSPRDAELASEDALDAELDAAFDHEFDETINELLPDGYDPYAGPDPEAWLALDEAERIVAVENYHRDVGIRVPNLKVHATLHVIVENQIAEGDTLPVRRVLRRLMAEGLDRHDALHAIGSVLIGHMHDMIQGSNTDAGADPNIVYFAQLERLTAASWRNSG